MDNLFVVIMAGGRGTRFWPLSREERPKQLLALEGGKTLLERTVERVLPEVPAERVYVVTGQSHVDGIREVCQQVPPENILVEPVGKNTAPAITFALAHITKKDPEAVVAVLPADHVVKPDDRFRDNMLGAAAIAEERKLIVTFGIKPTRPETGYGYIEVGDPVEPGAYMVLSFKEKPNRKKAKYYLDSGGYLWNSGMFIFPARTLLAQVESCLPDLFSAWLALRDGPMGDAEVASFYDAVQSESIDYGVMERSSANMAVIACTFNWSDVGSWDAMDEVWEADADGNRRIKEGELIAIKSEGNTVVSDKLVSLIGVEDMIVVETDDALLVCRKDRAQEIKSLVRELEDKGYDRYL